MTYVQTWQSELDNLTITVDLTVGGTPTAGNALVFTVPMRDGMDAVPAPPDGWSSVAGYGVAGDGRLGFAVYQKTSDGTEESVSLSWANSGAAIATVDEYSGTQHLIFESQNQNLDNVAVAGVTSQDTNQVSTLTVKSTVVAILVAEAYVGWGNADTTVVAPFTKDRDIAYFDGPATTSACSYVAGYDSTAIEDLTATFNSAGTGESCAACIIVFTDKAPAVSGTPPTMPADAAINVAEGSIVAGSYIADSGSTPISYTLSGADAALFTLNPSTGALTFQSVPSFASPLDAGANNVYNVVVTATNAEGSDTQNVAVTVTQVAAGSISTILYSDETEQTPYVQANVVMSVLSYDLTTVIATGTVSPDGSGNVSLADAALVAGSYIGVYKSQDGTLIGTQLHTIS